MHSFISYFKKSPGLWITVLIVIVFEISLYFIPRLYYLDGTGSFFVYLKREVVETKNDFDIIILGDSRSLSLKGIKKDSGYKYSVYNFSLPAAGPYYFRFLLEKYLVSNKKPGLVVFAGDPNNFNQDKMGKFNENPKLWQTYKHRLLNLFSYKETFPQYDGKELFFLSKEYFANMFYSVRFREVLSGFIGARLSSIIHFDFALYQRNQIVAKIIEENNGMINLGDFFMAPEGTSEKERIPLIETHNHERINTQPLENLVDYCEKQGLKLLILSLPKVEGLRDSPLIRKVDNEYKKIANENNHVNYLEFQEMDYPADLFSEAIHYNSRGEKKLNDEFLNRVIYQIYDILEK
ncbi:MAG: DUF1574 family protein [Leptospiraceae bacterium]|nr:DUF1574 family protein [Leptospiraceae bacterium]MCP5510850.1 DUF1574 family protein [Leptospiraceae bacterium]